MNRRPVPVPDEVSAPYWAAAARHELMVARCSRCGSSALPPGQGCPGCGSTDPRYTWQPASGRGTVASWTVIRQSFLPGFAGDLPFVLVDVELADPPGLRMIGRLLDGPGAPLRLGAPVTVAFEDLGPRDPGPSDLGEQDDPERVAVPAFRLSDCSARGEA